MSLRPTMTENSSSAKYVRLAQQLAERIRIGEWNDGRLPTVREIAVEYRVSSFTASRALHLLQEKGLVVTKERSGCFIAPAQPSETECWAVILRATPGPTEKAALAGFRAGLDRLSGDQHVFVSLLLGDAGLSPLDAVRAILEAGARKVVFLPSEQNEAAARVDEEFLTECSAAGLSVVLIDRNLRGTDRPLAADLVSADHVHGGVVCTRHLIDVGRKRIACVVEVPCNRYRDREAGYLSALQAAREAGVGEFPTMVFRLPEGMTEEASPAWLADRLAEHKADGVLCGRDDTAVGLIAELLRRGCNVPADVAVVGCDDLPLGDGLPIELTSYEIPSAEIVRRAVGLLRERVDRPGDPPVKVAITGQLVVRGSTGG